MGSIGINSSSGILALLDDEQDEMKEYALKKINELIPVFWAEIATYIPKIEQLYENEKFKCRELASLILSKVYYHLEQYSESMHFALGAGNLFDVSKSSEYIDTIIAKCIDEYIRLRKEQTERKDPSNITKIDPRLEKIVLGMFDRCFADKKFKQALGIALETRRLDKIEQAISGSDDINGMLVYCQKICMNLVLHKEFRQKVLTLLVKLHSQLFFPDYLRMCEILVFLDNSKEVSQILNSLIKSNEKDHVLLSYQIAFDLVNNGTQQFLLNVINQLPSIEKKVENPKENKDEMEIETKSETNNQDEYNQKIEKLKTILSGETTINLYLDFLFRNNHTDLLILKNIKNTVESRSSVLHTATIFAHAIMHSGTTNDTFLRENLEWLSKATNWSKFGVIAGLGTIHKGHLKDVLQILDPYLPKPNNSGSPYSEGGSLYALGLIHANHGSGIISYITNALHSASGNEIVQHGACLGLGISAMATGNDDVYEDLKNILFMDSAVAGEAAGLSMGLVMSGTSSQKAIEEMIAYAHETQHEKIIRGLAMGIAIVMYGCEEGADTLIEQLLLDKDSILRYGAMYTIGLAYCGTSNNNAIKKLLHVAVSDVSDDVRRAAVTCLGFVLCKQPEQCPKVVSLLSESYNPHVRYGACLALGISCAGTGLKEAIEILEPLTTDVVDFVRQGALIALAMILIQISKQQEPKVEKIRKLFEEKITDKHEEIMCKFGAIMATGIIDSGGRNSTISLFSRSGHKNMIAIVSLAVFTQFWYWYPLVYFISLSLTPTAFIGLNSDLKMPVFNFKCNAKPSLFAYPPNIQPPTTTLPTKIHTAVLSVAQKKSSRDKKKETEKMDIEKKEENKEIKKKEEQEEEQKKKKEEEPEFEIKTNPARVTMKQIKYLSFDVDPRYQPIKTNDTFGIIILKDIKPELPEELVQLSNTSSNKETKKEEPQPSAPFEYHS